jgi:DNA-binding beta-propeller fold protein YncE
MPRVKKAALGVLLVAGLLAIWLWPLGGRRTVRHWLNERGRAAATGRFWDPEGIAIDPAGHVWVADEDRSELFVLEPTGELVAQGKSVDGVRLTAGDSIAVLGPGHVVAISDQYLVEVRREGRELKVLRTFGRRGSGDGEFGDPEGIVRDAATGELYLADENNRRVIVYDRDGKHVRAFPVDHEPEGIALHGDRVYLAMSKAGWVSAYGKDGKFQSKFGEGLVNEPDFAIVAPDGRSLYITDNRGGKIEIFDLNGKHLRTIGGPGSGPGRFRKPGGLAFDKDGRLWVADGGNRRIQVFGPDGAFLRILE